ncbi:MAG TPA: hypothetical protein VLQ45_30405 [Thermoanaerobaculia bacterium]|nr:hypothetical protein [Thermoanaerobaculia bacterium]
MKRATSRLLLLLLLAALTAGPAFARGPEPARSEKQARGVLSLLWRSLAGLLPSLDKTRGTLDPDGTPAPETTGGETDTRSTIDPNG